MNFQNFTIKSQEVVQKAVQIAQSNQNQVLEPVHLLKAVMSDDDSVVKFVFQKLDVELREIQPDGSRHPFDTFICAKTPAGRWLDPQELTGPAVFLASEASNAVNGHILYVDGGILAYIGKQPK